MSKHEEDDLLYFPMATSGAHNPVAAAVAKRRSSLQLSLRVVFTTYAGLKETYLEQSQFAARLEM